MAAANVSNHLTTQVGGHPGVSSTEDGSLLIKPALPTEVAFYHTLGEDPRLAGLKDFVPEFYGTLRLEGKVESESAGLDMNTIQPVTDIPESEKDESQCLVLENLSYTFLKPNILDIKLGTVLADEDASPEKRARMEKVAAETTSQETGVRLTGFQVYDISADKPVVTTKAYGKSIKRADLPEGIARFFPLAVSSSPQQPKGSAGPIPSIYPLQATGLPPDLLLPVLKGVLSDIEEIYDTVHDIELRMVGSSLLIVYEADWERAREGLRLLHEAEQRAEAEWEPDRGEHKVHEEQEEDSDGDDNDAMVGPPFVVKLIDFAHTKLVPGRGPDEGVLRGLRTVIDLLKGRIAQIETASREMPSSE